jgi:glutamyl-tRNA synthetase
MSYLPVRVRFAPSPTGPLHIGGVRTALFNYLFARKHGGTFILRIEDTDQTRYVPGAEDYIIESLEWLGIHFNEGVKQGGPHGPYRQSERKALYHDFAIRLVENQQAYYAFDTPAELEEMRQRLTEAKSQSLQYDGSTRMTMRNSLSLPPNEVATLIETGHSYVIRLKVPENEDIHVHDIIRGDVVFHSTVVDDKVLFKSDGMPTYHLANVVDDHLMQISHVIRGEEWLPSTPIHVLLYRYLGWESTMPQFAHLPLLLKPDGKGKLSKRDGDRLGFPVFPLQWTDPATGEISSGYREAGYFPEALINFLAFLGWNPGTQQEIFNMSGLTEAFSLERVGKAGARFDFEKGKWFNQHYLKEKPTEELAAALQIMLQAVGMNFPLNYVTAVCEMMKERTVFLKDILTEGKYFFIAPEGYDTQVVAKRWKPDIARHLEEIMELFQNLQNFTTTDIEHCVKGYVEENQAPLGGIMNAFRLAVVGASAGPGMFELAELLGKDEIISRVKRAIEVLGK